MKNYLENNYEEIMYDRFYRELFPVGSFEKKDVEVAGQYNGIAISVAKNKRIKRFTVTDDLEVIDELVESDDFCIMSPISYAGKSRKSNNARFLYALAIDLDGLREQKHLNVLFGQIETLDFHVEGGSYFGLPTPTYIVSSGTGLHLYYFLEKPIPLFPNIVDQLQNMKRRLTWQAWTQGASALRENIQFESLFQGFRMVGSITKLGDRVRAFKVGDKVSLDYLNYSVPDQYKVTEFAYKSDLRLSEAKEKYPKWYQKRVVEKKPRGSWVCKRDLYDWWKRRYGEAMEGHRYWYIMTLATYAKKCGISREELEKDALEIMPRLSVKGDEPFTEDDVIHALEAYNDSYITYPIDTIVARTDMAIKKNKRNGRKQSVHLAGARAIQQINDIANGTNWRENNGRKPKKDIVLKWRQQNPNGTKKQCKDETGLTYPTIRKWWS